MRTWMVMALEILTTSFMIAINRWVMCRITMIAMTVALNRIQVLTRYVEMI